MKNLDTGKFEFSSNFSLPSNLIYWSRRFYRESVRHREDKPQSKNIGEAAFHGVSAAQMLRFSRMLRAIVEKLETNYVSKKYARRDILSALVGGFGVGLVFGFVLACQ